jgi:predicted dehydrogenase
MGMVGGGQGAFIGAVHRIAANMDGLIELCCGALSSSPEKAMASGRELFLNPNRIYTSFEAMIKEEAQLPSDESMDFVSIVTPNHMHFAPAKMAMEYGFDVIIDKPVTFSLAEAKELAAVIAATGRTFALTHTYTGYPMVKQARQMVQEGAIGNVRKIYVEYPQGWLSTFLEGSQQKQAEWRTDPARSGIAGCMGDIGTHAFNMAEYVSGLKVTHVCSDLKVVVPGRKLDDDGAVLMKMDNGATTVLFASQIAAGEENNIRVRVYGEKGGLEWQQADCNTLVAKWLDKPAEVYRAGTGYLGSYAAHNTRTPAGHPEGYLEAFANIYRNFALTLRSRLEGSEPTAEMLDFPGIEAGVRGMAFIENVVKSSHSNAKWTAFEV